MAMAENVKFNLDVARDCREKMNELAGKIMTCAGDIQTAYHGMVEKAIDDVTREKFDSNMEEIYEALQGTSRGLESFAEYLNQEEANYLKRQANFNGQTSKNVNSINSREAQQEKFYKKYTQRSEAKASTDTQSGTINVK